MRSLLSDNVSCVHPKIIEALNQSANMQSMPYGTNLRREDLNSRFEQVFEKPVTVVPCLTGTAANALCISSLCTPINSVLTPSDSHVYADECNAVEFFSGGARLVPVKCDTGKLTPEVLVDHLTRRGEIHAAQPCAISISQPNERGQVYSVKELTALGEFCRRNGLLFHLDGARFANAVVSLDCSPAETSWKCGVDLMSFGGTKNGCFAAECIVVFNLDLGDNLLYQVKKSGHLLARMHFFESQLHAFLSENLWLKAATHANLMAVSLYEQLISIEGVSPIAKPDVNILFVKLDEALTREMHEDDLQGYIYEDNILRLCTSWETTDGEISAFVQQF